MIYLVVFEKLKSNLMLLTSTFPVWVFYGGPESSTYCSWRKHIQSHIKCFQSSLRLLRVSHLSSDGWRYFLDFQRAWVFLKWQLVNKQSHFYTKCYSPNHTVMCWMHFFFFFCVQFFVWHHSRLSADRQTECVSAHVCAHAWTKRCDYFSESLAKI